MRIQHFLAIAVVVAGAGGMIVPTFAQTRGQGMSQMENGRAMGGTMSGGGMMSGGMMSGGMMSGIMGSGCARMMQSMNDGGQPNSQWQAQPHRNVTPG